MRNNERGAAVLVLLVIGAIVFAVMAYAVLAVSVSKKDLSHFEEDRARARYAAEAGMIWAYQKLWADPTYCNSVPSPQVTLNGLKVGVLITNCPGGDDHEIITTVNFGER